MKHVLSNITIGVMTVIALSSCGRDGSNGSNGSNGATGAQGPQGDQGETGPQGVPGDAAVLDVIDPCGDAAGIYDEVILRLANGQLLASFSANANGDNTRFSILTAGSYVTTDGSNCHFTVDAQGNVN